MSFKYLFELNGVELEDISIGASAIEKLEEPLDEASMRLPFTTTSYEYKMLGYLKITIVDEDEEELILQFLVISDDVSEGSKYGDFIHELTLIEYTHKYDKYMVHSLAKTKAIKDENPCKFLYNGAINYSTGNYGYRLRAYIEPLNFLSSYFVDENIVIPQVSKGVQATTVYSGLEYNFNDNIEVYIKIDGTRYTLSSSGVDITLSSGDYEIEYGFVSVANDYTMASGVDTWLYKYYVRVIDRDTVSVLDFLNSIRDNVSRFGGIESKIYFDSTRMFNIDASIEDYLASVEIPQTYIQKATLRQVLNSAFLYVNSISRLLNSGEYDTLSMDEFNKIVGDFNPSDISGFHSSQESNDLGSKGVSWLERVIPDNREQANIFQPSGNQAQTVRSSSIQITQDKFGLELPKPLYEPKKFTKILDKYTITDNVDLQVLEYENFGIGLTPRFITKNEWSIKDVTTNFPTTELQRTFDNNVGMRANKVGNIFWQQNSTYIELSEVFGYVWEATLIQNVIQEAFYEQLTRNIHEPMYSTNSKMIISYAISVSGYKVDGSGDSDGYDATTTFELLDWRYYKFNLEYITQENVTIESEREDLSYLDYYSEVRQNQSDKLINVENASRKSYGELQRGGVPNKTFQKYHTNLSSLYTVGLQDANGYVIVKRKLELHNNFILATYNVTKDHNRLSRYVGIQQAFRFFEIPTTSQIYERIEPYRDYIFIIKPQILYTEQLTKVYGDDTLKVLFGNILNDWQQSLTVGKTKITSAFIRTDKFLEDYADGTYKYAISTPVNSFGKKGGLVFQFGFSNNQIALNAKEEIGVNSFNKAIRYTDDLGEMNELWFQLSNIYDIDLVDSGWTEIETLDNYPLVRTNTQDFGNSFIAFQSGGSDPVDVSYDALVISKDKSQSITVPYQLNVLSYDYGEYVIGQEFYSENFLIKNPNKKNDTIIGTKTYLYVYDTRTPYGIFNDLKIKSGHLSKVELINGTNIQLNLDIDKRRIEFLGSTATQVENNENWAIGDELGNLYIACNTNHNGFSFFRGHFRPDLKEIGNKDLPIIGILQREYDSVAFTYDLQTDLTVQTSNFVINSNLEYSIYIDPVDDKYDSVAFTYDLQTNLTVQTSNIVVESELKYSNEFLRGQDEWHESEHMYKLETALTLTTSNIEVDTQLKYNVDFNKGTDLIYLGTMTYDLQTTINVATSNIVVDTQLKYSKAFTWLDYQWRAGGTTPTVKQVCNISADEGNVRCDSTATACNWDTVGGLYTNIKDKSSNAGESCLIEINKTECSLFGGTWYCQDYTADITEVSYSNCETCSEVEVTT